jgi:hypothetical protein
MIYKIIIVLFLISQSEISFGQEKQKDALGTQKKESTTTQQKSVTKKGKKLENQTIKKGPIVR